MECCLGAWARRAVDTTMVVFQAGVCCVYISLVSENVAALPPWPLGRAWPRAAEPCRRRAAYSVWGIPQKMHGARA